MDILTFRWIGGERVVDFGSIQRVC